MVDVNLTGMLATNVSVMQTSSENSEYIYQIATTIIAGLAGIFGALGGVYLENLNEQKSKKLEFIKKQELEKFGALRKSYYNLFKSLLNTESSPVDLLDNLVDVVYQRNSIIPFAEMAYEKTKISEFKMNMDALKEKDKIFANLIDELEKLISRKGEITQEQFKNDFLKIKAEATEKLLPLCKAELIEPAISTTLVLGEMYGEKEVLNMLMKKLRTASKDN